MYDVFNAFVRASEIQEGDLVAYENCLWRVLSKTYDRATGDRTIKLEDSGGRKSEIKYWSDYDPCVTKVLVYERKN